MTYLLDTNILSEVRKPRPGGSVADWWESVSADDVYLSVLVVGEIRLGIERLLHRRDRSQAAVFERWLGTLKQDFGNRVLPVTTTIAEAWGRLAAPEPLPAVDGLLAATALVHGLTLVTREGRRLERTGIPLLNPWV